jgi:hypothetical protein
MTDVDGDEQAEDGEGIVRFMVEMYGGDDEQRAEEVSRMLKLASLQACSPMFHFVPYSIVDFKMHVFLVPSTGR